MFNSFNSRENIVRVEAYVQFSKRVPGEAAQVAEKKIWLSKRVPGETHGDRNKRDIRDCQFSKEIGPGRSRPRNIQS